jgi:hypothetical protein
VAAIEFAEARLAGTWGDSVRRSRWPQLSGSPALLSEFAVVGEY